MMKAVEKKSKSISPSNQKLNSIPVGWKWTPFGEVFSFLSNYAFSRDQLTHEKTKSKILNIHYGDIHSVFENEILDFETESRIPFVQDGLISKEEIAADDFPLLQDGDLVIADASEDYEGLMESVELKNINGRKVVSGLHTFVARDKGGLTAKGFRTYILNHPAVKKEVHRIAQGISVYGISKANLAKIKILLPSLPEQKAIAKLLSTWDDAIFKTERLIAQKERQQKWLIQQLLSGKKRLKGFEKEKWKKLGAGEIFKSVTVKGFSDEELLSATQDKGMIPRTMLEGRVTMPSTGTEGFKLVERGDFIISLRSFQGGLEYSNFRGLVSPAYTVLKPKNKINTEFYKFYFKSYDFIGHLAIAVVGIRDGKQISYEDFCFVKIPYPAFEEQVAIANVLSSSEKEIQLLRLKTETMRKNKRGLMQQLLTGKISMK